MRRLALAIPLLALLAIPLTSGTAAANKSMRAPLAPLQIAEHQLTGWRYSLESLTSCEVGDGLAVVKNVGDAPLVITHVSAITSGSRKLMMSHWSYELLSVKTGSTTGELAGSFTLSALGHGRSLGPQRGRPSSR